MIAGQLVAQNMLVLVLMSQEIFLSAGVGIMQRMTTREKFGAVKTWEDALDTLGRVRAAMPGR